MICRRSSSALSGCESTALRDLDAEGAETRDATYLYRPRSFLIIGNTAEHGRDATSGAPGRTSRVGVTPTCGELAPSSSFRGPDRFSSGHRTFRAPGRQGLPSGS